MFTWICPQCGKEVPPHETECPHCARAASTPAPQLLTPEAPPATARTTPEAPQPQPAPPQPVYVVAPARQTPGWLVALLVAIGLFAIGGAAYYYLLPSRRTAGVTAGEASPFEKVPEADAAAAKTNRLSRFIEATGFRITEDEKKRLNIRFLIVNHSAADIGDLAGKVYLKTTEGKSVANFDFKTSRLGPYDSIEFTVLVSTTLRAYEVPDWQFLTADLEITSPSGI